MEAGAKIAVKIVGPEGGEVEEATVCRTTKAMGRLPDGHIPVRFAKDGVCVLVHQSRIDAAS